MCFHQSIVCPLPSGYQIIVSVAPPVYPSLPSFVSPYSLLVSAVLCWSIVFRVSLLESVMFDCAPVFCLPACLFFPPRGGFCTFLFHLLLKHLILLHLSPRPHLSRDTWYVTFVTYHLWLFYNWFNTSISYITSFKFLLSNWLAHTLIWSFICFGTSALQLSTKSDELVLGVNLNRILCIAGRTLEEQKLE